MRSVTVRRAVSAGLVVAAGLLAVLLLVITREQPADDGGTAAPTTSTPAIISSPTTAAPTTTVPPSEGPADVRVWFVRDELVATTGRVVLAPAVARGAMEALLAGPDARESELGMATVIPTGTELRSVAIDDGEATVDLSGAFATGGGSLSMQLRVAQVVFTLTQFDTVDEVTITLDGHAVDAIGGEGVDATDLTRADVTDVTPAILVESPVPDQRIGDDLQVTGIANTFEATLLYELRDAAGTVVDDGFATATAGSGTWGTFSFTADAGTAAPGEAMLTLWQEDADSGDRVDVYEVPLRA
jgi:hypothetical protein